MEEEENDTQRKILDAAQSVFVRSGFHGARMEEIAREAGINKALLHYYFRTKEHLFQMIFASVARRMFPRLSGILNGEDEIEEKVEQVMATYMDFLERHPNLPGFVINEMNRREERLQQFVGSLGPLRLDRLTAQIEARVAAGTMRPVTTEMFMVNLVSLCLFPFIARPMLGAILGLKDERFDEFIEQRKRELPAFFLNGLRP
ncbi:MAG TPA: TetR/AcrR family transcriptional regulator [Rhodothermales bacterium]|nr:TetR/AcrR family transcriptional regulator [Rhodothermales bacterium]